MIFYMSSLSLIITVMWLCGLSQHYILLSNNTSIIMQMSMWFLQIKNSNGTVACSLTQQMHQRRRKAEKNVAGYSSVRKGGVWNNLPWTFLILCLFTSITVNVFTCLVFWNRVSPSLFNNTPPLPAVYTRGERSHSTVHSPIKLTPLKMYVIKDLKEHSLS